VTANREVVHTAVPACEDPSMFVTEMVHTAGGCIYSSVCSCTFIHVGHLKFQRQITGVVYYASTEVKCMPVPVHLSTFVYVNLCRRSQVASNKELV